MKEYIEKEAFKQYLLDLKKQVNEIVPGQNVISGTTLSELIDRFPAAGDVVEVVRCKECKHSRSDEFEPLWCYVSETCDPVKEDHFCGYGERRDG